MIPNIIHQIWIGDVPIKQKFANLCQGVKTAHPHWRYRLWSNDDIGEIIATFSEQSLHWYTHFIQVKKWAMAVDIARLYVLKQYGGVYMDCDFAMQPSGSLDMLNVNKYNLILANKSIGTPECEFKCRIQNCFIASIPNQPFINHVCQTIGKQQYKLTTLSNVRDNVAYNCQYLTTEYLLHVYPSYSGKLPFGRIRFDFSNRIPPEHHILTADNFFGDCPKIAKHLYALTHRKRTT